MQAEMTQAQFFDQRAVDKHDMYAAAAYWNRLISTQTH